MLISALVSAADCNPSLSDDVQTISSHFKLWEIEKILWSSHVTSIRQLCYSIKWEIPTRKIATKILQKKLCCRFNWSLQSNKKYWTKFRFINTSSHFDNEAPKPKIQKFYKPKVYKYWKRATDSFYLGFVTRFNFIDVWSTRWRIVCFAAIPCFTEWKISRGTYIFKTKIVYKEVMLYDSLFAGASIG